MEIVMLSVDQIDASNRLRPVDDEQALLIGTSMLQYGQEAPIAVRAPIKPGQPYRLIAGAHRLRGAELVGMKEIAAIVRDFDDWQADMAEVHENLMRADLTVLARDRFLGRLSELYDEANALPEKEKKKRGVNDDRFVAALKSFTEATAERLGLSQRTIQRSVERVKHLSTEVQRLIEHTPYARNGAALDALGRLPSAEQLSVATLLAEAASERRELTVAEAVKQLRGVKPGREEEIDAVDLDVQRLLKLWKKSDVSARERFRKIIAEEARRAAREAA
jgi:ParB family chromosome partitioning protein